MIIFIHFNILLRFLMNIFTIVYAGKKNSEDISSDDDNNSDLDRTPRNKSPIEEGYRTPTQRDYEEISDLKRSLKNINRLIENNTPEKSDNNQPINPKDAEDLTNIEEEYSYFFDKDSGNKTKREALNEIKDKIEGELGVFSETSLAGLSDALKEISPEPVNKKVIEEQTERANTPETSENAMPASNTQPEPQGTRSLSPTKPVEPVESPASTSSQPAALDSLPANKENPVTGSSTKPNDHNPTGKTPSEWLDENVDSHSEGSFFNPDD
jgi:hypothetical protein